MVMSNYPNGFNEGVLVRNLPQYPVHAGKVFYVGNNSSLLVGEKSASDGNDGSFLAPFSTIDYAIGQCAADRGDIIYVRPSHAVSVTGAAGIAMDVSGVSLIGLGVGENRPTITFTTATAASMTMDANNLYMSNFVLKCNIASQNHMLDVTGKDVIIDQCDFREGSATGLSFITADTADNDSDRLIIRNCRFYAPTAGNYDNAIQLAKDFINVQILNCDIDGDFDNAGIEIPAGGNAQVNLLIKDCNVKNRLTNVAAISINGTDNSGIIQNCLLRTDTQSTALDNGSLATDNVRWADETDQVNSVSTLLNGVGTEFYVTKTLTSSAILTTGVDVTGASSGGVLQLMKVAAMTDATGLAAGTLFTLETNNTNGKAVFFTEAVADMGANATETLSGDDAGIVDAGSFLPIIESGKKIVAKCTDANCTGAGTVVLHMVFKRLSAAATIAAA